MCVCDCVSDLTIKTETVILSIVCVCAGEGVGQRLGKNASSSTTHERSQVVEDHRIRDQIKVNGSRPSLYNSWKETEASEDSKMQWNYNWSRSKSGRNRRKDH
jgi:hypothetical protein